jgi:hypothetical protein
VGVRPPCRFGQDKEEKHYIIFGQDEEEKHYIIFYRKKKKKKKRTTLSDLGKRGRE